MITISIFLVRVCIWVLVVYKLKALGQHRLPWVLLSRLWLSYYALIFACLVQLSRHVPWIEICAMTFHWKVKVDFICNKGLFKSWFLSCICSGGIYHIHLKAWYKYSNPFSSMPLVRIHLFFSIKFPIYGFKFQSEPHTSFRYSMKSPPPGCLSPSLREDFRPIE